MTGQRPLDPWIAPSQQARTALRLAGIGLGVLVLIYVGVSAVLIHEDAPMVATCVAQNPHLIWETSLTGYVIASATAFFALNALRWLLLPLDDAADAMAYSRRRLRDKEPYLPLAGRPQVRYGVMPILPDWLFLSVGAFLLFEGLVYATLAYWGFHELYKTDPWCIGFVQFDEIPLWTFGELTQRLQIGAAVVCVPLGLTAFVTPVWLDVVDAACQV